MLSDWIIHLVRKSASCRRGRQRCRREGAISGHRGVAAIHVPAASSVRRADGVDRSFRGPCSPGDWDKLASCFDQRRRGAVIVPSALPLALDRARFACDVACAMTLAAALGAARDQRPLPVLLAAVAAGLATAAKYTGGLPPPFAAYRSRARAGCAGSPNNRTSCVRRDLPYYNARNDCRFGALC